MTFMIERHVIVLVVRAHQVQQRIGSRSVRALERDPDIRDAHASLRLPGFTVRFSTLAAALADRLGQEMPARERRLRRYTRPDLLVLDEMGYLPRDSRAADFLYNIISRRHEQRSTIITTNRAFKQWGTTFPGRVCRLAHRSLRAALSPRRDPRRIVAREAPARLRSSQASAEPFTPQTAMT